MQLICCICGKNFWFKIFNQKLKNNPAFCSEECWNNNGMSHE